MNKVDNFCVGYQHHDLATESQVTQSPKNMNPIELITAKRDGNTLSQSQIDSLIQQYANGRVPDYQMAAFAMAVFFQGMTSDETTSLTHSMLNSGVTMEWSDNGRPKVDKHSTGGVGDKISIPLAPVLACAGLDVPMISGRGLGATGGTLDKLESIPNFRTDLSIRETQSIVEEVGCVITGASHEIAPADRKFYALRDVTGTIPSIPLITASILSKKLAEGLTSLVLDVKCGSGAFMKSLDTAKLLAESLVRVANQAGVKASALITNMNQPLGRMIGNSIEIDESLAILRDEGPGDVRELVLELATELLVLSNGEDRCTAHNRIESIIASGAAMERFEKMVALQGGRLSELVQREKPRQLVSSQDGFVTGFNSEKIGLAIIELGGGRKQIGDSIKHSIGVEVLIRHADKVEKGQPLYNVFSDDAVFSEDALAPHVHALLQEAIEIEPHKVDPPGLIIDRIVQ